MKLTLYRGDATKIKEFALKKTYRYCLLGQGIYLTDSLRIANSYRTKGSGQTAVHRLFYGQADNRTEAFELGFDKFCEVQWTNQHGVRNWWSRVSENDKRKFKDKHQALYRQLIEEKVITVEYTTPPVTTVLSGRFIKPSATIAWKKELEKKHKKYLKVEWEEIPNAGFITRFEFEEQLFNPHVFNVDKACNDDFFWTLMYDEGLKIGKVAGGLDDYIRLNKGSRVFDAVVHTNTLDPKRSKTDMWKKIGHILRPFGYLGYEYSGGLRLGGGHSHRAFCVWDEHFVNEHKVERFK